MPNEVVVAFIVVPQLDFTVYTSTDHTSTIWTDIDRVHFWCEWSIQNTYRLTIIRIPPCYLHGWRRVRDSVSSNLAWSFVLLCKTFSQFGQTPPQIGSPLAVSQTSRIRNELSTSICNLSSKKWAEPVLVSSMLICFICVFHCLWKSLSMMFRISKRNNSV